MLRQSSSALATASGGRYRPGVIRFVGITELFEALTGSDERFRRFLRREDDLGLELECSKSKLRFDDPRRVRLTAGFPATGSTEDEFVRVFGRPDG